MFADLRFMRSYTIYTYRELFCRRCACLEHLSRRHWHMSGQHIRCSSTDVRNNLALSQARIFIVEKTGCGAGLTPSSFSQRCGILWPVHAAILADVFILASM